MVERHKQDTRPNFEALGFHPDHTSQEQGIRQIAVLLLVVLSQKATIPAAGFGRLGLGHKLINHTGHILPGRGILGAG